MSDNRDQRSRTGCLTCRKRKKKCNEERPTCSSCRRLRLTCEYPIPGQERKNKKRRQHMGDLISPETLQRYISRPGSAGLEHTSAEAHGGFTGLRGHQRQSSLPNGLQNGLTPMQSLTPQSAPPIASPAKPKFELNPPSPPGEQNLTPQPYLPMLASPVSVGTEAGINGHVAASEERAIVSRQPSRSASGEDLFSMIFDPIDMLTAGMCSPFMPGSPMGLLNSSTMNDLSLMGPPHLSLPSSPSEIMQVYPELDPIGHELYSYFLNTQSQIMTVSPQNNFQHVFASMALKSRPVLCGVLAWASFHRNQSSLDSERGHQFTSEATALVESEDSINLYTRAELLATLLLLASAHICSGDVRNWRQYLALAAKVIKDHGGVSAFMESESVQWLLKNYAYHEILASSSRNFLPLFSPQDLNLILQYGSKSFPDTLCACCQPILTILASINALSREVRGKITSPGANVDLKLLQGIADQANELEKHIYLAKPDQEMILNLDGQSGETQVVLFEAFQHLSVLYLYDSVLQMNASSLKVRSINELLLLAVDSLMGTNVEGILIFPLFIAGVTCCVESTRPKIIQRFENLFERHQARNIRQVCTLLREVWSQDDFGTRHVDWNELAERKGWHLSFA